MTRTWNGASTCCCGRGTTIFAARIKGHRAYGIDCSPIAIAIARAKLAETTAAEVMALAERILEEPAKVTVLRGEFRDWAYAPITLRQVCILREGLRVMRSGAAGMLRAICLGSETDIIAMSAISPMMKSKWPVKSRT